MSYSERVKEVQQEFARAGFVVSPLSYNHIVKCLANNVDAYKVGCDVACGFSFNVAFEANSQHE